MSAVILSGLSRESSRLAARLPKSVVAFFIAATVAGSPAGSAAQESISGFDAATDSQLQLRAATLMPLMRGRWVYTSDGLAIGRVLDVRVSRTPTAVLA